MNIALVVSDNSLSLFETVIEVLCIAQCFALFLEEGDTKL